MALSAFIFFFKVEEWLKFVHSIIRTWLVECCRNLAGSSISTEKLKSPIRETVRFLVTFLTSCLLSLAGQPALSSVSLFLSFFDLRPIGSQWVLHGLESCTDFSVPFARYVIWHGPVWKGYRHFLWPLGFTFLRCIDSCEALYRQRCIFINHV